jgi:hypothetical protein
LELHHLVLVREEVGNKRGNLIALCPACHALHQRWTIPADALSAYKSILVALTAAFDLQAIDQLLFLAWGRPDRPLLVSGDGVVRLASLIGAGYAEYQLVPNNSSLIVTYQVGLTQRGAALIDAWKSGRRGDVETALQVG